MLYYFIEFGHSWPLWALNILRMLRKHSCQFKSFRDVIARIIYFFYWFGSVSTKLVLFTKVWLSVSRRAKIKIRSVLRHWRSLKRFPRGIIGKESLTVLVRKPEKQFSWVFKPLSVIVFIRRQFFFVRFNFFFEAIHICARENSTTIISVSLAPFRWFDIHARPRNPLFVFCNLIENALLFICWLSVHFCRLPRHS